MNEEKARFLFKPVTAKNWPDLEALFGPRGACAGCWCMYWRVPRKEFTKGQGEVFRNALKALTEGDTPPGLIAYEGDLPVGWISVGKREEFVLLAQSKVLAPVDDQPVWSIVCFFVARSHRKQGLMLPLINAAVDYAASQGARIVEGYPIDMRTPPLEGKKLTGYSGFMGIASVYRQVGFVEVGRASETQLIMRYQIV